MAADASVGIRITTPDSDGVFLGGRFLGAGVDLFVGAAMLRDPSVAIGFLGGVSVQLARGARRNPAYGALVRHQFGVTGLSRRAQPFHWRVGAGANMYYENYSGTVGGGPGASFRLG